MKIHNCTTLMSGILIFGLSAVVIPLSPVAAQTAPSSSAASTDTIVRTVSPKHLLPSQLVYFIKTKFVDTEADRSTSKLRVGITELLAAKDSDNTLTIRGTPDDVELLLELVRYLDVKPRVVQVSARLIEIRLSEKGVPKESILQTPTIITRNNTPATCVTNFFDKSETKLGVTPHLNVDGSVSLTLSLSLRLFSGGAIATGEVKKITGLGKQGEWNPIQTISLSVDKEIQKTLRTSIDPPPAAAYPLYRLEVAVTEVSY